VAQVDDLKERAVSYASDNNTHLFMVDSNVLLHHRTLTWLHDLRLEVVGPMLAYDGVYGNFHADVDAAGYYKSSELYFKILNREFRGIHQVPVVNGCYLIRRPWLRYARFHDHSARPEYVIFSDWLRRNLVPQYIDNRHNYGLLLNHSDNSTREIADTTTLNNQSLYLNLPKKVGKRGVICDIDWLSTYVVFEHYHLVRLLQDEYGFDILNSNRLDFRDPAVIDDLSSYEMLLVAYHRFARIPLDLISSYKIYKMDDMVNDPYYTELVKFYMKSSDLVISPYAYVLRDYYDHDNVEWVPYSCALEGCEGFEEIRFNETPKLKVLQLGNVSSSYPLRQYVATLDHESIEKLPHPGWNHPSSTEAMVRTRYYKKLNEYICCFTDALSFRYIVCKNFEIPAVGALLLADKIIEREMNELGFIDYETCIFLDQSTFLDKVSWVLANENRQEVDRIRRAGMMLVREKHMTRHRAARINALSNGVAAYG
jgi:hypothetical protein